MVTCTSLPGRGLCGRSASVVADRVRVRVWCVFRVCCVVAVCMRAYCVMTHKRLCMCTHHTPFLQQPPMRCTTPQVTAGAPPQRPCCATLAAMYTHRRAAGELYRQKGLRTLCVPLPAAAGQPRVPAAT